jgi:hypothetical protein
MIGFSDKQFLVTWKNSPRDEDQPGQRVLYSQSLDGVSWTKSDGSNIMFPNISTTANPVALFAGPPAYVNGRTYASASPVQFCQYPTELPVLLLLRQVLPGLRSFGAIFWATDVVPPGYEAASAANGIKTVDVMDPQTQLDVAVLLDPSMPILPCAPQNISTKCEACPGGCQPLAAALNVSGIENERALYAVPSAKANVLLYRSRLYKTDYQINHLYASVRTDPSAAWPAPVATNIRDDVSNLNAGVLPDGRVFLVSNAMPQLFRSLRCVFLSRMFPLFLCFYDKLLPSTSSLLSASLSCAETRCLCPRVKTGPA